MVSFRVATNSQNSLIMANLMRSQQVVTQTSIQVSSGKESRTYSGIASESSRLVSLENATADSQRYLDNNTLVKLRLQYMETSVSQLFDVASSLKQDLLTALNFASDGPDPKQGYTGVRQIAAPTTTTVDASPTGYGSVRFNVYDQTGAVDGAVTIDLDQLRTELENDGIITTAGGPLTEQHIINAINGVYGTGGAQQLTNPVEGLPQSVTNASGAVSGDFAGLDGDGNFQIKVNGPGGLQDLYSIELVETDTRIGYYGGTSTLSEYFGFDTGPTIAANGDEIAIAQSATTLASQVSDLLSIEIDGRYLFSGSKIGTKPIDIKAYLDDRTVGFPPADLDANASSAWYRGDETELSAKVSNDLSISYGVTASNDAIDKLVRGIRTIVDARNSEGELSGDRLKDALNLINGAIQELPDVRSQIGRDIKSIEETDVVHEDFKLIAKNSISGIEDVDVVQAASRLSAYQTQMEASYLVLSGLNKLTLLNFL
ncbi:MAG: flagellin [Acetobacterales bacterium]